MSQPKRHAYESGRQDQYVVRLPNGMRDKIKEFAARNNRSMNAEIIYRLSNAYGVDFQLHTKKADALA